MNLKTGKFSTDSGGFTDLVPLALLQDFQDAFSKTHGVPLILLNPEWEPVTEWGIASEFLDILLDDGSASGVELGDRLKSCRNIDGLELKMLPFDFAPESPEFTWLIGPVSLGKVDDAGIRSFAAEFKYKDPVKIYRASSKLPVSSEKEFKAVTAVFEKYMDLFRAPCHIIEEARSHIRRYRSLLVEKEQVLSNTPAMIVCKDLDYRYRYANSAYTDFIGAELNEIIGKTDFDLYPEETACRVRNEDEKVLAQGHLLVDIETPLVNAQGQAVWLSVNKSPVISEDSGEITSMISVATDITEKKTARTEIHLLATALNQTAEAIVITDIDANVHYVNPAFEQITGYSIEEILGRNMNILKSGRHDSVFYQSMWQTILSGDTWNGGFINKRKDGAEYEEEAVISPIREDDGTISRFVAVKRDITNEKKLERQLHQSQKMSALGRLAGGVAHDFNNILTSVIGYADILLHSIPEDDSRRGSLEEIKKAGTRASNLTRQLLAFSRKQLSKPVRSDVNKLIKDMKGMFKPIIGDSVKFRIKLADKLSPILIEPGRFEQVMMNIVINACDSMPGKGELEIRTRDAHIAPETWTTDLEIFPGDYVHISVSDTGTGMDVETMQQIYEPFFTTKAKGKGTGLGMSTTFGIVKQFNGFIKIDSEPGVGTTVNLYFPIMSERDAEKEISTDDTTSTQAIEGGEETILVVDDDPGVLNLASKILRINHYTVYEAANARDALKLAEDVGNEIDLLLTDIVMPGMNGYELAGKIRESVKKLPVVLMTGHPGSLPESKLRDVAYGIVLKPFTTKSLAREIRLALERASKEDNGGN